MNPSEVPPQPLSSQLPFPQVNVQGVQPQQQLSAIFALQKELYTVNDALGILCSVASGQQIPPSTQPQFSHVSIDWRGSMPPHMSSHQVAGYTRADETTNRRQEHFTPYGLVSTGFDHPYTYHYLTTDLARSGLLVPSSIPAFVDLFFDRIEPFFPFIHEAFRDVTILAQHEVLLWTICAISCKYSDSPVVEQVSSSLWIEARRRIFEGSYRCGFPLIGDARLTEVAAVSASILLTQEWTLDSDMSLDQYNQGGYAQLSMACQLAKASGVLSRNKGLFVGLHMMDFVISCRLGLTSILDLPKPSAKLAKRLSLHEQARIAVTCLLGYSARTLFASRESTRELVESGSLLVLLGQIHAKFETWLEQFKMIAQSDQWESRNVMFEFYHCRLYVYSLALVVQQHELGSSGSFDGTQHKVSSYIQIAVDSAANIVRFETNLEFNPVGFNFAPPMRWIVRFIHATVFLAKILLSSTSALTTQRRAEILNLINRAANAMSKSNPKNFQLMGHVIEKMGLMRDQILQLCSLKPIELSTNFYTQPEDPELLEFSSYLRPVVSPATKVPTTVDFQYSSQRSSSLPSGGTDNIQPNSFGQSVSSFSNSEKPDTSFINVVDNWELTGVDSSMMYLSQYPRHP